VDAIQSFKKTIKTHRLFSKEDKLLIAVSGGADSMALTHICHALGYDIGLVHMNFQLRGSDSNEDAAFVEKVAANWNVAVHIQSVDCKSYAAEHKLSIQESARDLRYAFFEEVMTVHDYDYLLTAHHARDNVETMVYTLSKGASIKALRGIPLTRKKIVRPLLYTTSDELASYVRANDIRYRHDISNDDTKYRRNFIRHKIIPQLEEINPNIESTLSQTAILGDGYDHLISSLLSTSKSEFITNSVLDLESKSFSADRFAWLYEHIKDLGFNVSDTIDIWTTYDQGKGTGKVFHGSEYSLIIDRHDLRIEENSYSEYQPTIIPSSDFENTRIKITAVDTIPVNRNDSNVIYIDANKIDFPLTLRRWQPGDRFKPSGMNGKSKKLKDYLTNQKVSGSRKLQVEVLLSENEIIWVVGYRMAHEVGSIDSSNILKIEIKSVFIFYQVGIFESIAHRFLVCYSSLP